MTQPRISTNLKLVTLPPAFGMRNVSPFCLKVEMLLTALGLPFELGEEGDPRKVPKGKLPFLLADGKQIADSELIALYLDEITEGGVLGSYSPTQMGEGTAIARLVEDHLYWILVASRWLDDAWWPNVVDGFFASFPGLVRPLISGFARRQVRQTYHLQGLGRHSLQEQRGFAQRDLQALAAAVEHSSTLDANSPRYFDFTLAGFLAGLYDQQPPTWVNELADGFPQLKEYTEQVQQSVGVWGRPV
jgi:glutathione S-transferase